MLYVAIEINKTLRQIDSHLSNFDSFAFEKGVPKIAVFHCYGEGVAVADDPLPMTIAHNELGVFFGILQIVKLRFGHLLLNFHSLKRKRHSLVKQEPPKT